MSKNSTCSGLLPMHSKPVVKRKTTVIIAKEDDDDKKDMKGKKKVKRSSTRCVYGQTIKESDLKDYLMAALIGGGIGGGTGAGLGIYGGHLFSKPWEELGVTEEVLKDINDARLAGTRGPQEATKNMVSEAFDDANIELSDQERAEGKAVSEAVLNNPKTTFGITGGLGGAGLGALGGVGARGIYDLLGLGKESNAKLCRKTSVYGQTVRY